MSNEQRQKFRVLQTRTFNNVYCEKGSIVELTKQQAKYPLMAAHIEPLSAPKSKPNSEPEMEKPNAEPKSKSASAEKPAPVESAKKKTAPAEKPAPAEASKKGSKK